MLKKNEENISTSCEETLPGTFAVFDKSRYVGQIAKERSEILEKDRASCIVRVKFHEQLNSKHM